MKPEYVMLVGLPASGKSTLIKKLQDTQPVKNYMVVSSDDIIEEMGNEEGLNYGEAFAKFAKPAMKEMDRRLNEYVKAGHNIIHDQTNLTVKSRKTKLDKVGDGYDKFAIVFELSDDEWKRRKNARKEETGKVIPWPVIGGMKKSYVRPSINEGFLDVTIKED